MAAPRNTRSKSRSTVAPSTVSNSNQEGSASGSTTKSASGGALEDEEWYHGEDINKMLRCQGDFLVRRTEVQGSAKHVLSVFWDGKARHVVLHKNDAGTRHLIDPNDKDFGNIQELIRHYKEKGDALPRVPYVLLNPVPRQDWEIRHEQITLEKKLGEGAFGEVYRATMRCRDGSTLAVAVKRSHATRELSKDEIAEIVAESRIMQKFKHEHLVRLWGVAAETQPVMLVLELVSGGGLDSYLQKNTVPPSTKVKFCLDAARGMEYLHKMKCIHRDVACRNCLLTADNEVKISDFGLSQEGTSFTMKASAKVPIRWLAPETICTMTYTLMTDVWSFGILMWEVFHNGQEPYPGMRVPEVAVQVKNGYKMPIETDAEMPSGAKQIVGAAWISDPKQRPKMRDIRERLELLSAQMTTATSTSTATTTTATT